MPKSIGAAIVVLFLAVQAASAQSLPMWEYADLSIATTNNGDMVVTFIAPGSNLSQRGADALSKFYTALGARGQPLSGPKYLPIDLLNAVGQRGWELVYFTEQKLSVGTIQTWAFKRRAG